jgi:hypothetical protein
MSSRKPIRRGEATGESTPPRGRCSVRTQRNRYGDPTITAGPGQFRAIQSRFRSWRSASLIEIL